MILFGENSHLHRKIYNLFHYSIIRTHLLQNLLFAPLSPFFGAYLAFWMQLSHARIIWSTRNIFASVNNIANWLSFFRSPLYRAFTKPNWRLMSRNGCSTLARTLDLSLSTNSTLRALPQPEAELTDSLTDLLRAGARNLIAQAVEVELQALLEQHAQRRLPDGCQAVVCNGYLPERTIPRSKCPR